MGDTITKRYEFLLLFDVESGNPNGDPDADNHPRMDFDMNIGWVSDVALKRKIRNYVLLKHRNADPHRIYVTERGILNRTIDDAHRETGSSVAGVKEKNKDKRGSDEEADKAKQWMCDHFFDVRTFGAVMSTGHNAGQVRGPVQIAFAKSVEPIEAVEQTITRMAVTSEEDAEKQKDNRTMGRKWIVPYGLYRAEGFVSAFFAEDTGFSGEDLALLWEALTNMFEHDRSAARGRMSTRKLFVFEHDSALGNAPAHTLFDLVAIKRVGDGDIERPARSFSDYAITINRKGVPAGVNLHEMV